MRGGGGPTGFVFSVPESQTHPAAPPRTSLCGKDSSHWPMLRMGKLRPREAQWPNPGLLTRSPLPSLPRSGSQGLPPQTGAGPAHLSPSCSGAGPRVRTGCLKPLGSLRGPKQTRAGIAGGLQNLKRARPINMEDSSTSLTIKEMQTETRNSLHP